MNVNAQFPGSIRVPRVGFGVAPKQAFLLRHRVAPFELPEKVRDREDALASTPDACAPQKNR
jgi:hypothetical protein